MLPATSRTLGASSATLALLILASARADGRERAVRAAQREEFLCVPRGPGGIPALLERLRAGHLTPAPDGSP
jgi:hypothetical protein